MQMMKLRPRDQNTFQMPIIVIFVKIEARLILPWAGNHLAQVQEALVWLGLLEGGDKKRVTLLGGVRKGFFEEVALDLRPTGANHLKG